MDTIALILAIIGSLNWGLVGFFRFDLVAWLFGGQAAVVSRIIYCLLYTSLTFLLYKRVEKVLFRPRAAAGPARAGG